MKRVRGSTWVALAIFLAALTLYILLSYLFRQDTTTAPAAPSQTSTITTTTTTTVTPLRLATTT